MVFAWIGMPSWSFAEGVSDARAQGNESTFAPGGGEAPTPFEELEFVDGKTYLMTGKVMWPYIRVESASFSPYLRTPTEYRYYVLEGAEEYWARWNHLEVQLLCRAHVWDGVYIDGVYYDNVVTFARIALRKAKSR
jgi:hypothetical protein